MITLKIGKAICPVCDVSSVSCKLTTLGVFFVDLIFGTVIFINTANMYILHAYISPLNKNVTETKIMAPDILIQLE